MGTREAQEAWACQQVAEVYAGRDGDRDQTQSAQRSGALEELRHAHEVFRPRNHDAMTTALKLKPCWRRWRQ